MTRRINIAANEYGIVRVFTLPHKTAMEVIHGETLAPLEKALGASYLDPEHVQVTALGALGSLGLTGLLEEGHGISAKSLAPDRARLNGLTGHVAIVRSRAFVGAAVTLNLAEGCALIGDYAEEGAPPPRLEPLISEGAKGVLDGNAPGEEIGHRASRRTLLIAVAAASVLVIVLLLIRGPGG